MKKYFKYTVFLILLLALATASCKKKNQAEPAAKLTGNYFSIKDFALDEWNTFAHDPFVIVKTVKVDDGKTDSSYTNSDTISWAPIFKTFFETDISDTKYLGKYKFTQFPDNHDGTYNFLWEADPDVDEDDLLTKKMLLTMDQQTRKVKGIYIETNKKILWSETTEKLYYSPMKTIQIQTDYKPLIGKSTFTIVQYDFML